MRSDIGADIVSQWAGALPEGARVLDIGAGTGLPVTDALVEAGLDVHAVDASPRMVERFRARHPDIPIAREDVRTSALFGLPYAGVVAVGLVFLLSEQEQAELFAKISEVLLPGGRLLISAPRETGSWDDILTGHRSHSLGDATYRELLRQNGFTRIDSFADPSGNHYYSAAIGP